jgi:F0F1-type ATP synthase delta subunit
LRANKKQREKYKTERKTLFDFSEERNNLDAWEEYLNKIEKEII